MEVGEVETSKGVLDNKYNGDCYVEYHIMSAEVCPVITLNSLWGLLEKSMNFLRV